MMQSTENKQGDKQANKTSRNEKANLLLHQPPHMQAQERKGAHDG